jgi:hypothetical protein
LRSRFVSSNVFFELVLLSSAALDTGIGPISERQTTVVIQSKAAAW